MALIAYVGIRLKGLLYLLHAHGRSRWIRVPEWLEIPAGRFLMLTNPLLALNDGASGLAACCIMIRKMIKKTMDNAIMFGKKNPRSGYSRTMPVHHFW